MKTSLVYIEWHDACSQNGWHNENEVQNFIDEQEVLIKQVGWIIHETPRQIVMSSRIDIGIEPNVHGMLQKIPKTWIRKRIRLDKYV